MTPRQPAAQPVPQAGERIARILIVDDEAAQMKALCDTLGHQGYEAVGFTQSALALAALREGRFDLLLSDLMMPGMDGIALLQEALLVQPELVGIIMTGEGTIATAVEAMKVGAFDYILKPFKVSAILPILARAMAMSRLRTENALLAGRVRERTELLVAANQELEAFTHSISHDLRAPLRSIHGFSRILRERHGSELSTEASHLLEMVAAGAVRMDGLIDDLLRLSHVSRDPLVKRQVDMSALVEEVLQELREQMPERHLGATVGSLPPAMGDRPLLKQVFVNLLGNAYKFTRKTDRALVEVGCTSEAAGAVYFVKDNGAGFDMRYADKLFGVFQRMTSSTEFEGTGIGLSIVKCVVQRHGGRIWANAEIGKGATFQFTLP